MATGGLVCVGLATGGLVCVGLATGGLVCDALRLKLARVSLFFSLISSFDIFVFIAGPSELCAAWSSIGSPSGTAPITSLVVRGRGPT